jgi:hypothetical protein
MLPASLASREAGKIVFVVVGKVTRRRVHLAFNLAFNLAPLGGHWRALTRRDLLNGPTPGDCADDAVAGESNGAGMLTNAPGFA